MTSFYDAMVEAAAERAAEAGMSIPDLVSIAEATEQGFDAHTFTNDVKALIAFDNAE
jgi:hypothetical protein